MSSYVFWKASCLFEVVFIWWDDMVRKSSRKRVEIYFVYTTTRGCNGSTQSDKDYDEPSTMRIPIKRLERMN